MINPVESCSETTAQPIATGRMMKRTTIVAAVIGLGLGGMVGAFTYFAWPLLGYSKIVTTPSHPVWTEVKWPFPMDAWGKGKAFRCGAADCGVEVNFYIRAKIGFCNCATGVSDDDELDRLSDFSLMGDKPSVLGPGHPIRVAWMNGRSRSFAVADSYRARTSALAVAFNEHCDAVVATVVVAHDRPAAIEPSVIEFLNSQTIIRWTEAALGL
jgi:hypothetical protein